MTKENTGMTKENTGMTKEKYGENTEKILLSIEKDPFIKTYEIADKTQLSQATVEKAIAKLKKSGVLKRIGPDKGGHWEAIRI